MKATIEIPDELYRQVKAKSALEGRAVREVTTELFQRYVHEEPLSGEGAKSVREEASRLLGSREVPSWFGVLGKKARRVPRHDMEAIRGSIAAGISRERDL